MRQNFLLFILLSCVLLNCHNDQYYIKTVQNTALSYNREYSAGDMLNNYPFFDEYQWQTFKKDGQRIVRFIGYLKTETWHRQLEQHFVEYKNHYPPDRITRRKKADQSMKEILDETAHYGLALDFVVEKSNVTLKNLRNAIIDIDSPQISFVDDYPLHFISYLNKNNEFPLCFTNIHKWHWY